MKLSYLGLALVAGTFSLTSVEARPMTNPTDNQNKNLGTSSLTSNMHNREASTLHVEAHDEVLTNAGVGKQMLALRDRP